jgi:hypothetical protein
MFTAQLFYHFRFANMTRRKLAQKQEAKQTGLVSNTQTYTSGVWPFFSPTFAQMHKMDKCNTRRV